MQADPVLGDIVRLMDDDWRRRIGNYRTFYELVLELGQVRVYKIERRTSTTY